MTLDKSSVEEALLSRHTPEVLLLLLGLFAMKGLPLRKEDEGVDLE